VEGEIHGSHSALAQQGDDFVIIDMFSNHGKARRPSEYQTLFGTARQSSMQRSVAQRKNYLGSYVGEITGSRASRIAVTLATGAHAWRRKVAMDTSQRPPLA
jgi:hypothetical protein